MTKLSAKMAARLKNYRSNLKSAGFSMLEAVVVVGVLLALAVSGFIAYGNITNNAKNASVQSAAASVYTAVLAANMDGQETGDATKDDGQEVIDAYNASQTTITVAKAGATDDLLAVKAQNNETKTINAVKGNATTGATITIP
jgi:type II secretory pathway pseudopilin PulG